MFNLFDRMPPNCKVLRNKVGIIGLRRRQDPSHMLQKMIIWAWTVLMSGQCAAEHS